MKTTLRRSEDGPSQFDLAYKLFEEGKMRESSIKRKFELNFCVLLYVAKVIFYLVF